MSRYIKVRLCSVTICKNADAESTYHHTRGTYTQPQINRTRQDELKARLRRSLFTENDICYRTRIQINHTRQVATTHHPQQQSSPSSFVFSYNFTSRILYFNVNKIALQHSLRIGLILFRKYDDEKIYIARINNGRKMRRACIHR